MAAATTLMTDERVLHYWDGASALIKGYTNTLNMPEDAWDIYAIYAPGTTWDDGDPPAPAYWMHQLGTASAPRVDGPYFNITEFTNRTNEILSDLHQ